MLALINFMRKESTNPQSNDRLELVSREDSFRLDASRYEGVSYHDDALTDSNWDTSVSWTPPNDLRSGVYALKMSSGESVDRIPVIIRPDKPRAKIAVQMSTFTYLAYDNEHLSFDGQIAQAIVAHTPVITGEDIEYYKLEEFGLSTYDHHSGSAGVCYSSWKRPIINIRPGYRMAGMNFPWALPADLSLLRWLEHAGYEYDLLTGHDVDREGSLRQSHRQLSVGVRGNNLRISRPRRIPGSTG